jgi:hypothetical protein
MSFDLIQNPAQASSRQAGLEQYHKLADPLILVDLRQNQDNMGSLQEKAATSILT